MELAVMAVTEKDIRKVLLKHPWLPYDYAKRIAEDLKRKNTTTPEGLRAYNREYARLRRVEKRGEKAARCASRGPSSRVPGLLGVFAHPSFPGPYRHPAFERWQSPGSRKG